MAFEPRLIIQIPRGSAIEQHLRDDPPSSVAAGDAVVEAGPTDPSGNLEALTGGEVVLSMPAPASLSREARQVHRVLTQAGPGPEPLVVVIEAAEELTDADLGLVLDAAAKAPRPVILRIVRDA